MRPSRSCRGLGLGILIAAFAVAAGAVSPGDLSGNWKLNRDASDDPHKKVDESTSGQSSRGGWSGGGGSGGGGGYGGHGGGHRGGGGWRGGDGSSGPAEPPPVPESLHIVHQDPKLVITESTGPEHVLYTDGRKTEEERSLGGTTAIRAQWKDGHVVVDIEPERGRPYTETYSVTGDGKQLTVTTRWKGRGGQSIEIRRVYDAVVEAPAPAAASEAPKSG